MFKLDFMWLGNIIMNKKIVQGFQFFNKQNSENFDMHLKFTLTFFSVKGCYCPNWDIRLNVTLVINAIKSEESRKGSIEWTALLWL